MAPPNTRGPLEVLVGPFTDFSDFLGRLLVIVEFYVVIAPCEIISNVRISSQESLEKSVKLGDILSKP
jgi:hypothetical protein